MLLADTRIFKHEKVFIDMLFYVNCAYNVCPGE